MCQPASRKICSQRRSALVSVTSTPFSHNVGGTCVASGHCHSLVSDITALGLLQRREQGALDDDSARTAEGIEHNIIRCRPCEPAHRCCDRWAKRGWQVFPLIGAVTHRRIAQAQSNQGFASMQPEPELDIGIILHKMHAAWQCATERIAHRLACIYAPKVVRALLLADNAPRTRQHASMSATPYGQSVGDAG